MYGNYDEDVSVDNFEWSIGSNLIQKIISTTSFNWNLFQEVFFFILIEY